MLKLWLLFIFLFSFLSLEVYAVDTGDVVINEINWAGSFDSSNDEWIELYNRTDREIDLEGWILKAEDGSPEITLKGKISGYGFYLLERTDDNSAAQAKADQIYKGALENSGEDMVLYNNSLKEIDRVESGQGWFAGDNKTKRTMERISNYSSRENGFNWQTSAESGGTPKEKNSQGWKESLEKEQEGENFFSEINQEQKKEYPKGIIINEILASAQGPDKENEWIEIFNKNDFDVELQNWQIKDKQGKITAYIFPEESIIKAKGYLVLKRPQTKIVLNNEKDGVELIQPNGRVIDSVAYEKAVRSYSYSRVEDFGPDEGNVWVWSSIPTPGGKNKIEKGENLDKKRREEEILNLDKDILKDKDLLKAEAEAEAGKYLSSSDYSNKSPKFHTFLIAFLVAFFGAGIFLALRISLEKMD